MKNEHTFKFSRLRLPWALKVHCWGGLGSQLFALAMVEELSRAGFPRKIELVLHNSGVTRRESEIDQLSPQIKISKVQDFGQMKLHDSAQLKKQGFQLRFLIIFFFRKLGVVIFSEDISHIRPWTLQLRSHYTHQCISKETLNLVGEMLKVSPSRKFPRASSALHYRLGDLLTLAEKTYVSPERLIPVLNKIKESGDSHIDVFSDSLEVALGKLQSIDSSAIYNLCEISAWDSISTLSMYKNLVATNSKIGIWGILLRLTHDLDGLIFAPNELKFSFEVILDDTSQIDRIIFY